MISASSDLAQLATGLGGVEERQQLLGRENRLDLDGRQLFPLNCLGRLPACGV